LLPIGLNSRSSTSPQVPAIGVAISGNELRKGVQDICRRLKIALERIHVEGPALVQRRTINVRTGDLLGNSEIERSILAYPVA
jgi:hypothetical protein